jgi:hypothetical protein
MRAPKMCRCNKRQLMLEFRSMLCTTILWLLVGRAHCYQMYGCFCGKQKLHWVHAPSWVWLEGPEVPRIIGRYKAAHYRRERLFTSLKRRYNIKKEYYCYAKRLTLPSSKATVKIICNDAGAMIRSLLTDPRISKKDYLFHDDDCLRHPTRNRVHSGHKYGPPSRNMKATITNPDRQILLPVPMYADGCVSGNFNLSLTQVKITIGFLNGRPAIKIFFGRISALYPKSRRISREAYDAWIASLWRTYGPPRRAWRRRCQAQ